jgi:RNA polymerase sigma-70 factor, ECF subfamily
MNRAVDKKRVDTVANAGRRDWVGALKSSTPARDEAIADLYGLLLRGAHFELGRRRGSLVGLGRDEVADLATQAADDAIVAILAKLDTFRGASRFTTWAYKFVLFEAAATARRRAWQSREVTLDDGAWPIVADASPTAHEVLEQTQLLDAVRDAVQSSLTANQRRVFCALVLNGVPSDVLAAELDTTRGALYKTLHDARRKLRATLAAGSAPAVPDVLLGRAS